MSSINIYNSGITVLGVIFSSKVELTSGMVLFKDDPNPHYIYTGFFSTIYLVPDPIGRGLYSIRHCL